MQLKFWAFIVFAGFVSCSENNKPSGNNAIIVKSPQDSAAMAQIEQGKELFLHNCVTCHSVNADLTGPALRGVESRWKDQQKLYAYIKNSQAVIKEDAYANDLFNRWNKVQMTAFEWLKDEQITSILQYIKAVEEK